MTGDALGYYRILGAEPSAEEAEIKRRYRDLAKQWHPDYNKAENALEVFQKLSVAYEVLQDEDKRLDYDLLSAVYEEASFPEPENIQPLKGEGDSVDLRMLTLWQSRGRLWKSVFKSERKTVTYSEALRLEFKNSLYNWVLGWWGLKAWWNNLQALQRNFKHVDVKEDNLRLLVHNAVAYRLAKNEAASVRSAVQALEYADAAQQVLLRRLLTRLNVRGGRPRRWNFGMLRLVQLVIPGILLTLLLVPGGAVYLSESELWSLFSERNEISYYQEVSFGSRGRSVDDMVVGKILNIPVDRSDNSKLYHLETESKIMYGPSDEFDVLKVIPARTTVRLTGMSPDNIWARVMIDNGEMGFVRLHLLTPGIGLPIPEFSRISH